MNDRIRSLRPQFVGKTELQVTVRRIGYKRKIVVTVLDYTPVTVPVIVSDKRAHNIATEVARKYGAFNTDCTVIHGGEIKRNTTDSQGKCRAIRVRSTSFYFSAVN